MKPRKPAHSYRVEGEVAYVEVYRKGVWHEVIVDLFNLELVLKHRWNLNSDGYARTSVNTPNGRRTMFLHHLVLPRKDGFDNDHINRIRTDNRRSNLRHASKLEQSRNTNVRKDSTTGLKGVLSLGGKRGYSAAIQIKGKRKHLGVFRTPEEAHKAYLEGVHKYH